MSTPYAKLPAWADYGLIPLINLAVAFIVAGLVVLVAFVVTGAILVMFKQRRGLHSKREDRGVFVYASSKRL